MTLEDRYNVPVVALHTAKDDLHLVSHQTGMHAVLRFSPERDGGADAWSVWRYACLIATGSGWRACSPGKPPPRLSHMRDWIQSSCTKLLTTPWSTFAVGYTPMDWKTFGVW